MSTTRPYDTFTGIGGQLRYRCRMFDAVGNPCQYDTYSHLLIQSHCRTSHIGHPKQPRAKPAPPEPPPVRSVDIIIAHYGKDARLTKLCLNCLRSIREHTESDRYRLILADNGTPADQFRAIEEELNKHPHKLIRFTENAGFIAATNAGLWLSSADAVMLMNNDTEAVPGWLDQLCNALKGRVGLAGPRTTTPNSWQGRAPAGEGVRILGRGHMLAFFCVAIRRTVIEREIGRAHV